MTASRYSFHRRIGTCLRERAARSFALFLSFVCHIGGGELREDSRPGTGITMRPGGRLDWRTQVCGKDLAMRCSRRGFVQGAAAIGGGAVLGLSARPLWAQNIEPTPVPKRKFERIDLEVPILSLGTVSLSDAPPISRGLEWGMFFVHTCANYGGGRAIRAVAEAIRDRRDEYVIGFKDGFGDGETERGLELLGTDHIEIAFFPTISADQARDERIRTGFERCRDQGLVKYLGLTAHDNVPEVLEAGLEAGWYDVFMPSYYPANSEQVDPIMERAAEQGIGGMVMKSFRGLGDDGATRRRWWANILNKPWWTTICKSVNDEGWVDQMGQFAHIWQDFVDPEAEAEAIAAARGLVCTSCGTCTRVCPQGLSPSEILRYEMYAVEYDWRRYGRSCYAALPESRKASACTSCGTCRANCKGLLDVPARLREAHLVLA